MNIFDNHLEESLPFTGEQKMLNENTLAYIRGQSPEEILAQIDGIKAQSIPEE